MTRQDIQQLARRLVGEAMNRQAIPSVAISPASAVHPSAWSLPADGIAAYIDHTLLHPDASEPDIIRTCAEAREHRFHSVCIHPDKVATAARELRGSAVKVCTVIGFPHGANITPVKLIEAEQALKAGAHELDMVVNIGALKSGRLDAVHSEIRSIAGIAHSAGATLKVILELSFLDHDAKQKGCAVALLAGADFVKTSTGFGPAGADPSDVALMHHVVGGEMGIKAAGGIRTYSRFRDMMSAGATRIGTSSGVAILEEFQVARNAVR